MAKTVNFTRADFATKEEQQIINNCFDDHVQGLTKRIINSLLDLRGNQMGYRVDQFEHALQTATRVLRDGGDRDIIVCALLHDIGEHLAPVNHGELAAAIVRPYVSLENTWMLQHHGILQSKNYIHELATGQKTQKLESHPAFDQTIRFYKM